MDVIWLNSPQHTGTHFIKFMLELHPNISFWTLENTKTPIGKTLTEFTFKYMAGEISRNELKEIVLECPDSPTSALIQLPKLGFTIPKKTVTWKLLHTHGAELRQPKIVIQHNDFKRIILIKRPLSIVLSLIRRNASDETIVANLTSLSIMPKLSGLFVTTDLPYDYDRIFDYLNLTNTPTIEKYIADNPQANITRGNYLLEAKKMLKEGEVHPALDHWIEFIKKLDLQQFYESLGYSNLPWYN